MSSQPTRVTRAQRTEKVVRFAKIVTNVFLFAAPVLPFVVLLVLLRASPPQLLGMLGLPPTVELSFPRRAVTIALGLLPSLATARALLELRACAMRIASGAMFDAEVSQRLRSSSTAMVAASVLEMVVPTLAALLVTAGTGHLTLTLHFGSGSLMAFVLAASLRLTSGLVVEARTLADENAEFI